MKTITIPKKELKTAVKKSIREVLEQEFMSFRAMLLPYVSQSEQKDIEKRYRKPSRKAVKTVKVEI